MGLRWLVLLGLLCVALAQESGDGSGEGSGEGEASGEEGGDEAADEVASEASGDGSGEEDDETAGDDAEGEEDCEVEETDGSGSGDDVGDILALGGEDKKCKKKPKEGSGEGSGEEASGADALAEALGAQTCDKEGMDPKIAECLGGLETQVGDLMTAIMGPDGGGGTLEDKITLVLVKKGVISCENETQCDDNKQCLKQPDGMSRCQDACERQEIIMCNVPFSECISEDHTPSCRCKENFHGNGTDVCIPMGFDTEDNKRGYRMFDEEYLEWENATQKCQELGARLPVLSDVETIKIVKKYLDTADFDVFEVSYADETRHYGFYIDGDIAKLPGGGRRGAAVLCELIPDQLAEDPNPHSQGDSNGSPQGPGGNQDPRQSGGSYPGYPGYPSQSGYPGYPSQGGYPSQQGYPNRGGYPDEDGGYPSYPAGRR